MAFIIALIVYVLIASLASFLLMVFASRFAGYEREFDIPWPVLAGVFWPVGAPIAAAYIAAIWFTDSHE